MLELKLFPNAKELTESFCCFNAVRTHLGSADKGGFGDFGDASGSVLVVAVGDGYTPRTAALFGFRTKWRCVSIDPLMTTPTAWEAAIERLRVHCARYQDVHEDDDLCADRVLLVLPHAHISLTECVKRVRWRKALAAVVLPCCDNYAISKATGPPMIEEEDRGVVSPHRLVRIWHWTRRDRDRLPPGVPPPLDMEGEEEEAEVADVECKPCAPLA